MSSRSSTPTRLFRRRHLLARARAPPPRLPPPGRRARVGGADDAQQHRPRDHAGGRVARELQPEDAVDGAEQHQRAAEPDVRVPGRGAAGGAGAVLAPAPLEERVVREAGYGL